MNKQLCEILCEYARERNEICFAVMKQIDPSFSNKSNYNESVVNSNDYALVLQEIMKHNTKLVIRRDDSSHQKGSATEKTIDSFSSAFLDNIKKEHIVTFRAIAKTLMSIQEIIPKDLDSNEKRKANILRDFIGNTYVMLNDLYNDIVLRLDQTNGVFPLIDAQALSSGVCRKKEKINGEDYIYVKFEDIQEITICLINDFSFLVSLSMECVWLHQEIYNYYHGSADNKKQSDALFDALSQISAQISAKMDSIAKATQQTNSKLDTMSKTAKQIVEGQDDIKRKIVVQGDRSSRENKKLEDKITERNQKKSRNELTQMDCARVIAEERKINYEAKKSLLDALKMSTETIDKDKNPDEENIVRTIERWDTGKTKPPEGYSRRISEYEFREWVKKREKRKLDNWIVKIRRSLKAVQAELVPEAVLDEWMRLNSGNDNDPYSKINE